MVSNILSKMPSGEVQHAGSENRHEFARIRCHCWGLRESLFLFTPPRGGNGGWSTTMTRTVEEVFGKAL